MEAAPRDGDARPLHVILSEAKAAQRAERSGPDWHLSKNPAALPEPIAGDATGFFDSVPTHLGSPKGTGHHQHLYHRLGPLGTPLSSE